MTQNRSIPTITRETIAKFIDSKQLIILRLDGMPTPALFAPQILEHFRADYSDQVDAGCFGWSQVLAFAEWAPKIFGAFSEKGSGYYLFVDGKCVAFHSGTSSDPKEFRLDENIANVGMVAHLTRNGQLQQTAGAMLSHTQAERVIKCFEPIVQRMLPLNRRSRTNNSETAQVTNSPEKAKVSSAHDLLGVARHASPEEIKQAYRQAMAQNHPDKVAHLSDELQAVAQKKTREIKEAYEELMKRSA